MPLALLLFNVHTLLSKDNVIGHFVCFAVCSNQFPLRVPPTLLGAVVVVVSKIEWEPFLILNSAWPGSMSLELEKWTQLKYIF